MARSQVSPSGASYWVAVIGLVLLAFRLVDTSDRLAEAREQLRGTRELLAVLERSSVILPATSLGVRGVHNTAGLE